MSAERPLPEPRSAYRHFRTMTTRWKDNDVFGHINNVEYYSFFDTLVCAHMMESGVFHFDRGDTIAFVKQSSCNYFAPIAFPDTVTGGLRVEHIGNSAVRWGIGLFRNDEDMSSAGGYFLHVFVNRETQKPVASLPAPLRAVLEPLCVD